jgi:hypothetical protein
MIQNEWFRFASTKQKWGFFSLFMWLDKLETHPDYLLGILSSWIKTTGVLSWQ